MTEIPVHRAEVVVEKWLRVRRLNPVRFSNNELVTGQRSPDFRVLQGSDLRFFCEVKSVDKGVGAESTSDPLPNKLTKDIHESYKQFQSVNSKSDSPNVLAFVSYNIGAGVDYLEDVLLGSWYMSDGRSYPFYKKYAWGKIKDEKGRIDLYLWFESPEKIYFRFTGTNETHFQSLCKALGLAANDIKNIEHSVQSGN